MTTKKQYYGFEYNEDEFIELDNAPVKHRCNRRWMFCIDHHDIRDEPGMCCADNAPRGEEFAQVDFWDMVEEHPVFVLIHFPRVLKRLAPHTYWGVIRTMRTTLYLKEE